MVAGRHTRLSGLTHALDRRLACPAVPLRTLALTREFHVFTTALHPEAATNCPDSARYAALLHLLLESKRRFPGFCFGTGQVGKAYLLALVRPVLSLPATLLAATIWLVQPGTYHSRSERHAWLHYTGLSGKAEAASELHPLDSYPDAVLSPQPGHDAGGLATIQPTLCPGNVSRFHHPRYAGHPAPTPAPGHYALFPGAPGHPQHPLCDESLDGLAPVGEGKADSKQSSIPSFYSGFK